MTVEVKCAGGCGRTLQVREKHYDEADDPKDKAFTCFWCSEGTTKGSTSCVKCSKGRRVK